MAESGPAAGMLPGSHATFLLSQSAKQHGMSAMKAVHPSVCGLLCLAFTAPTLAVDRLVHQDWRRLESEHFNVITNTPGDTPQSIINDLELFRSVVLALTGVESVQERLPTTVVVFRRTSEFNRLTRIPNILGYMRPTLRGNWMVSAGGSLRVEQRTIMFHEYVHHLLRSASSVNYPSWYDEGLADMLATIHERDGRVVIGAEHEARIRTLKNSPLQVPLEKIVNTDDLSDWHPYHVSYFYAMSWALVNYLNVGHFAGTPSRVEDLQRYLALTQAGRDRQEAFVEAFRMSPREMEDEVNEFLGERMRPVIMLPRDRFAVAKQAQPRRLDALEMTHELAWLAMYTNHKLSRSLLEDQLEVTPRDARLTSALGVTYQLDEDYARGAELTRAAVRMDPTQPELAIDLADLLVSWNGKACETRGPECDDRAIEAEANYERALSLEPDNPEAHARLANLLRVERRKLDDAAEHVELALSYQRWSPPLNLLAGQIYLALQKSGPAREHLERALYWSESESIRKEAATALKKLEGAGDGSVEPEE
jgi:tetratricopeptide (TPR) repeat protein